MFGGQVAAQAARAASLTVPDDRSIHSLHGYFLRGGQADRPTILHVDRDRDGRSYSSRHVAARQNGEVIMSLLVSFHVDEDGREFQTAGLPEGVALPDDIPEPEPPSLHSSVFELRILGHADPTGPSPGGPYRFWARCACHASRGPSAARVRAHLPV